MKTLVKITLAFSLLLSLASRPTHAQKQGGAVDDELEARAVIVFTRLLKSENEARRTVKGLRAYTSRSPWQFPTVLTLAQKLLVHGFKADDLVKTFEPCGDLTAALDGNDDGFSRVVLGMAALRLEGAERVHTNLEVLSGLGIPAYRLLGEALQKSPEEVVKLARDERLNPEPSFELMLLIFKKHYGGIAAKLAERDKGNE